MKLAIIRQRYNPYGGAERFVARALQALQQAGTPLELSLITRDWQGAATSDAQIIHCRPPKLGRLTRDWGFARAVQKLIARQHFDLVQSHERIPGCDIFRAGDGLHQTWLELRARSLNSFERLQQQASPWHRYTCAAEDAMLRHPRLKAVICNSHMVQNDIAQRYPALQARLHVIHNGVDLDRFSPALRAQHRTALRTQLGIADTTPVVVYVGSGFARKGVPQLIDALQSPSLQGAQLWVIGKDKASAQLERLAKSRRIAVHFAGPQADVGPWLGAADVFALPTLYDPMPNAALEALASGLPVLCSNTCGAAELIGTAPHGAIVDALDVADIAAKLSQLVRAACDPHTGPQLREAARQSVEPFSQTSMAERLIELYQHLLLAPAERR